MTWRAISDLAAELFAGRFALCPPPSEKPEVCALEALPPVKVGDTRNAAAWSAIAAFLEASR